VDEDNRPAHFPRQTRMHRKKTQLRRMRAKQVLSVCFFFQLSTLPTPFFFDFSLYPFQALRLCSNAVHFKRAIKFESA
jgi:hypothetical protein